MRRNVQQTILVFLFDRTSNIPITGQAGTLTCETSQNDGARIDLTDQTAVEVGDGYYRFNVSADETNFRTVDFFPTSSVNNAQAIVMHHNRTTTPTTHTWTNTEGETIVFTEQNP